MFGYRYLTTYILCCGAGLVAQIMFGCGPDSTGVFGPGFTSFGTNRMLPKCTRSIVHLMVVTVKFITQHGEL